MDRETHQYNTRSKSEREEKDSTAKAGNKAGSYASASEVEVMKNEAVQMKPMVSLDEGNRETIKDETTNNEKQQRSKHEAQYQVEQHQEGIQQQNKIMLLLQQVIFKQDMLLEENRKLKHEMEDQQLTINSLTIAIGNLQGAKASEPDPRSNVRPAATTSQQQHVQQLTESVSQATKQLQGKRITKLLEITPFTGLPDEDVDDWLTEFDKRCEDVQLEGEQRLSVARDLLKGTAKLWNETYEKTINDWQTFKRKITAHFMLVSGIDQFTLGQKLYNRQQQPNEDGMSYFHSMIRLCSKVNPSMDDTTRVKHLIKGLSMETKMYMEVTKPQNTDDFLQALVKLEQLLAEKLAIKTKNVSNRPPGQQPSTTYVNDSRWTREVQPQQMPTAVTRTPRNSFQRYPGRDRNYDEQQDSRNNYSQQQYGSCYACGARDHFARNCPSKNY